MKKLIVLIVSVLFTACASNPMSVSEQTAIASPAADESQVVFMRDSFVGSAIKASLYDVSGDKPIFIGIIANGTKVPYRTEPGEHTFMVVSEAADFMEANLAGGKTYYSLVTPRMGMWKARFSLWPIKRAADADYRLDSDNFQQWLNSTKVAEKTPEASRWFQSNKNSVEAKQEKYWPVWGEKSEDDLARRTLILEDGQ